MKHHHHLEKRRHTAPNGMSKEAEKITALITALRKSVFDIDRCRARAKADCDQALRSTLDIRRGNLMDTIAVLEDRLSAMQGLIELDRPHIAYRMH